LYKIHTFIVHQCQVRSIDLKIRKLNYYPRWNITVLYENQTRDDSLIASTGFSKESQAWNVANEYKINETYLCYRAENDRSVIQWDWQWNEPSKVKAAGFLFVGIMLLSIGGLISMLKRHYQEKFKIIRQQHEYQQPTGIPLRNGQQHRATVTLNSSSYDQTVQEPPIIQTRI
ncbi:unnamed protein product, partial [Rotaria sordida]